MAEGQPGRKFSTQIERVSLLRDCTQDSAYPRYAASSDISVSADASSDETRWAELFRILLDPGTTAYALAPTDRANEPVKVNSGDAVDLMTEAERAGAGQAIWAVVAPLRADLLVLDIDECADEVWPTIRDAAADVGAGIVHCATSGRPNCLHAALTVPTPHAYARLEEIFADLRERHAPYLPAGAAIDVRGRKPIRLPGSASLKGHGHCTVVDEYTLAPITAIEAVKRAVDAAADDVTQPATPGGTAEATPVLLPSDDHSESHGLQWESPRAWRARQRMSPDEWRKLNTTNPADRSMAATEAAWLLWRHGVRSFAAARWWYEHLPAFAKFRDRDVDAHRKAGRRGPIRWEACQQHWQSIVRRARAHRPAIPASDQAVIDAALEEISWWPEADLAAAAAVIVHQRYRDGHGITARPVARRDLSTWLHLSDGTAARTLQALVRRGLLVLVERWPEGNPRHANLYTLAVPSRIYRGKVAHDVTSPRVRTTLTHPLWAQLGHTCRRVWAALQTLPSPTTSRIATLLGLPTGDQTYGVLRSLHHLGELGLVQRTGRGRGTRWVLGATTPDDAAATCGALDRARQISARVVAERRCWHAESRSEQDRSRRGLEVLRRRLTHADAIPGMVHAFTARTESSPQRRSGSRYRRTARDGPG